MRKEDILASIRLKLAIDYGEYAVGHTMSSLAVKIWSPILKLFIVRSSRDEMESVRAAVSSVQKIDGKQALRNCKISVIHTGGTIRSCQKVAAEYIRFAIVERRKEGKNSDRLEVAARYVQKRMRSRII